MKRSVAAFLGSAAALLASATPALSAPCYVGMKVLTDPAHNLIPPNPITVSGRVTSLSPFTLSDGGGEITMSGLTASLGDYLIVTGNWDGTTLSSAPRITSQPTSVVVSVGKSASFAVAATGANLKYQWYKGGSIINGATSATFTISSATTTSIGTYYATITNSAGSVTSNSVTLRVVTSMGIWAEYEQSGGNVTLTSPAISAAGANESAIWVTNGGVLTVTNPSITTSGSSSSQDNSSFYGLNAGVLASAGTINITGGAITTSGMGANGAFATGSGASVTLSGVTINASGDAAHGVMATQGGSVTCTNVDMTTRLSHGAAIATDRGGGTINYTGGTVYTYGADSPGIYSTGAITVSNATIHGVGAEAAVIEGSNSITLTDTVLSGAVKRGVMLYQSMSGDAQGATSTFTMTGGALSAAAGPLLYVTNATGIIKLTGVNVTATSGTLLNASAGNWGASGRNGGKAVLTADGETLTGNMTCDSISSISATLQNNTVLTGAINSAALTLDSTSRWNVTANSVLTTLSDSAGGSGTSITNIYGNGCTVYYKSSLSGNSWLGGKTYSLANGGTLTPQ